MLPHFFATLSGRAGVRQPHVRPHFVDANKMVTAVFPGEKIVATSSRQFGDRLEGRLSGKVLPPRSVPGERYGSLMAAPRPPADFRMRDRRLTQATTVEDTPDVVLDFLSFFLICALKEQFHRLAQIDLGLLKRAALTADRSYKLWQMCVIQGDARISKGSPDVKVKP